MTAKYKCAGIVAKPDQTVIPYLQQTIEILKEYGIKIVLEKIAAELLGQSSPVHRYEIANEADIIILFGGDGTFLSVSPCAVRHNVPIAGFNLGSLGFLTEIHKEKLPLMLKEIFFGEVSCSKRKTLRITYHKQSFIALNDVIISKGNTARMIKLLIAVDGQTIAEIGADGVIVATPTGSTAYSLSAGGPIVSPKVNGLIITPICAHSLTFRPIIIPDSSTVTISMVSANSEVFITIDGQKVIPMEPSQSLAIKANSKSLSIIKPKEMNYFKLLSDKLKWGQ
jgi:NAD+ kinase